MLDLTSLLLFLLKVKFVLESTPLVFYEIFVRSFADDSQDGIGDLQGIIQKLDYLKYLGVEGIWLSPIFQSVSYHKYDVTNYYQVDPDYGTLEDFDELVQQAKEKGIKIILDLVVSHTSWQHPWFKEAQSSPDNTYRDYYIWKSPKTIKRLQISERLATADSGIVQPWHNALNGHEKYYGIFSETMPDLNLENLFTRIEILEMARFWLKRGVYGFRLDAAKHIYPSWVPVEKNITFWNALKQELKKDFPDVFFVGEVWSEPKNVAPFFQGIDANFDFELCYDIRDTLLEERDIKGLVNKLIESYNLFEETNNLFIDATFLGNHDLSRIASVCKNQTAKIKAAANLLFTLPGMPFIYYGDELGTEGEKPDKSIREPFLWNYVEKDYFRTKWQKGHFSNDLRLSPLSVQSKDESSVFNHYRKLIAFRKRHHGLLHGNLLLSNIENEEVISFIRETELETLLILQNVSMKRQVFSIFDYKIEENLLATEGSIFLESEVLLEPFGLMVFKVT